MTVRSVPVENLVKGGQNVSNYFGVRIALFYITASLFAWSDWSIVWPGQCILLKLTIGQLSGGSKAWLTNGGKLIFEISCKSTSRVPSGFECFERCPWIVLSLEDILFETHAIKAQESNYNVSLYYSSQDWLSLARSTEGCSRWSVCIAWPHVAKNILVKLYCWFEPRIWITKTLVWPSVMSSHSMLLKSNSEPTYHMNDSSKNMHSIFKTHPLLIYIYIYWWWWLLLLLSKVV